MATAFTHVWHFKVFSCTVFMAVQFLEKPIAQEFHNVITVVMAVL